MARPDLTATTTSTITSTIAATIKTGLFVAVPILSLIVVLVDELWARPLDDREGIQEADSLAVAVQSPID